jgi:alanine racemase
VLDLRSSHYDMVRPGLMLYGAAPAPRFAGMADLKAAMSWVTGVSHLKWVPKGTPISYGHKWTAPRESLIDMMMVDATDVASEVRTGSECVLLGRQGEARITAEEMAAWCDTIPYEIFCAVGSRVPRVAV